MTKHDSPPHLKKQVQTCPPHHNKCTTPGQHIAHANPRNKRHLSGKNAGTAPHLPAIHRLLAKTNPTTSSPAGAPPHTRCGTQHRKQHAADAQARTRSNNTHSETLHNTAATHSGKRSKNAATHPHIHTRVSNNAHRRHRARPGTAHDATQHRSTATRCIAQHHDLITRQGAPSDSNSNKSNSNSNLSPPNTGPDQHMARHATRAHRSRNPPP